MRVLSCFGGKRYQQLMPVIFGILAVALGLMGLALAVLHLIRTRRAVPSAIVGTLLSAALVAGGGVLIIRVGDVARFDPDEIAVSSLPEAPASDGRQLRSDRSAVAKWRELRWAPGRLRVEVPKDWAERLNNDEQLDLHAADVQSTFLTVRVSSGPDLNPNDFLRVARLQAASRLAGSRIIGYSVKKLGAASGVVSFERSKDDTKERLNWTTLLPGSDNQLITISVGAAAEDFDAVEPVLGAILESVRIE